MNRKLGFTLAEVLITLAIIGVVAALTLPTLIANHNKKVIETRLVKLYSTLNQAIQLSSVDNGNCNTWDFGSSNNHRDSKLMVEWWNKYISKYLYSTKEVTDSTINYGSGNGNLFVKLNDGSTIDLEALPGEYAWFKLYPTGDKKDNTPGKDFFDVYIFRNTACQLRTNAERYKTEDLVNRCENVTRDACLEIIKRNDWKIPKDYPIKLY